MRAALFFFFLMLSQGHQLYGGPPVFPFTMNRSTCLCWSRASNILGWCMRINLQRCRKEPACLVRSREFDGRRQNMNHILPVVSLTARHPSRNTTPHPAAPCKLLLFVFIRRSSYFHAQAGWSALTLSVCAAFLHPLMFSFLPLIPNFGTFSFFKGILHPKWKFHSHFFFSPWRPCWLFLIHITVLEFQGREEFYQYNGSHVL